MGHRLREVGAVFVRLGATAFGGPAAHIALMRHELVERRRWQDEQTFVDLVGITSLLPGPNSTELAIELGRRRAGRAGLVLAGVAFVAPAAVLAGVLAWAYDRHGATPFVADLRTGLLPVVVAVVAHAAWVLGRSAVRGVPGLLVAVAATAGYLAGVHELVLLGAGAAVTFAWHRRRYVPPFASVLPWLVTGIVGGVGGRNGSTEDEVALWRLGGVFLRIGATLFGSGYVLVAFLDGELVQRLGVLSERELLDAVAVGQVTPGPLFTTATFAGYLVAGTAGAVVATVAIFLPAFVLVAALGGRLERWLRRPSTRVLLDGLNAAAVGLIAGVAAEIAGTAVHGWPTAGLAAVGLAVLVTTRLNPSWVLLGGALCGLLAGVV